MNEAEYFAQEIGQIYMSPAAFGEIKKFILNICEKENSCDIHKTKKRLNELEVMIDGL